VKYCPVNRQTMLFSATMTSGVDDLVKLSLKRPVRIKTQGDATTVAPKLSQEFVRVRREEEREAMLASLVCRNFNTRVIVFFETKREAHRFFVLLSLLESSLPVCELHGDMTQPQRETALQRFIRGDCEVLIATDVAARGLDISNIQTVINSEMPRSTSTYVHRVGRTARAGKYGRSVTLVSDSRRKVMKDLLKSDASGGGEVDGTNGLTVLSRTVPSAVISHYASKIAGLEGQIVHYFQEEKVRTQTDSAMREVERAENLLIHEVSRSLSPIPPLTPDPWLG
jgi:ATP-dependent RNA helicase DDX27